MIKYTIISTLIISITIYVSFRTILKEEIKKRKVLARIIFLILITSFLALFLYLKLSNFWLGKSIENKIKLQINIEDMEANEVFILKQAVDILEKKISKNPNNFENFIKLAETKFILGDFNGALYNYQKAQDIYPKNIEAMKGQAKIRLIIENNNISKKTLDILETILSVEPNNLLSLYVIGNNAYNDKDLVKAYSMFKKLKGVLKQDTPEYNEIKKKLLEMEKNNERN